MQPLRIGLLGCGVHGYWFHANYTQSVSGYELVGLYDPNPHVYEWYHHLNPKPVRYGNEDELIGAVDAVIICSRDEFHAEQCLKAIKHGKHVLVEKPVAINMHDLDLMRQACRLAKSKGLALTTCHSWRTHPGITLVRDRMPNNLKKYGRVVSWTFEICYQKLEQSWRKDANSLLLDHGCHEVDTMNFVLGRSPARAYKFADSFKEYAIAGVRKDGVTFFFRGTRSLDKDEYWNRLMLRFERAEMSLVVDMGGCTMSTHEFDNDPVTEKYADGDPLAAKFLAENFIQAARWQAPLYLSPEEMMFNAEFCLVLRENGQCEWDNTYVPLAA